MRSPRTTSPTSSRAYGLLTAALLTAVFLFLAVLGGRQDGEGLRALTQLDAPVDSLRAASNALYTFLIAHPVEVGWFVTACAAITALFALASAPRATAPLALLGVALACAAWGQVMLSLDRIREGIGLYALGVGWALVLGVWFPLRRLPGFFGPATAGEARPAPPIAPWEWLALILLTGFAMLVRLYGLNEMPSGVDVEMIASMLQSGTLSGVRTYAGGDFFSNSTGIAHFPFQWAASQLVGHSAYSLRLAAAGMGVVCVPLFHFLVRRIAGPLPAVIGTLLYLTAPEQVYWSRSETTIYIAVSLLALVTVHLSLWMIERRSWTAALAVALWMPFSRVFYHAGIVMFLHPIAAYAHALLFVRGTWRSVYRIVPMLAFGLLLWTASLTGLKSAATGAAVPFINPFIVSGHAPWSRQGDVRTPEPLEIVRAQVTSIAANLGLVMNNMTYKTGFSGWYQRHDPSTHRTITNVGLIVLVAVGLGYLLGQFTDPRAWTLLVWIAIGLLPGVLSLEPADRRIALIFPALPAVAAVTVAVAIRLARAAGRLVAALATLLLTTAAVLIALTSLASQLLLPMHPLHLSKLINAGRAVLADSDVVLYDLVAAAAMSIAFGGTDTLTGAQPPCLASLERRDALTAALDPQCSYATYLHEYMLPPSRIAELEAQQPPRRRITFLLSHAERSRELDELLQRLYPKAQRRDYAGPYNEYSFTATTVLDSDIRALHAVRIDAPAGGSGAQVLASIPAEFTGTTSEQIVIRGGLLTAKDDWPVFALTPACDGASVWVDDRPQRPDVPTPLPAGAHALEIRLPSDQCTLPVQLMVRPFKAATFTPWPAAAIVSPAVTAIMRSGEKPVDVYPGYRIVGRVLEPGADGVPLDFAFDGEGRIVVAQSPTCTLRRYGLDGKPDADWSLSPPSNFGCSAIAVGTDGTTAVFGHRALHVYSPSGALLHERSYSPPLGADADFTGDGRLLMCSPPESAVFTIDRGGALRRIWSTPPGGPERLEEPMGLAVSSGQDLLVVQISGQALLYRAGDDGTLSLDATLSAPYRGRFGGSGFDGRDRIVLATPETGEPLTYAADGRRLVAEAPQHDLSVLLPHVRRVRSLDGRLYVLNGEGVLHVLERRDTDGAGSN